MSRSGEQAREEGDKERERAPNDSRGIGGQEAPPIGICLVLMADSLNWLPAQRMGESAEGGSGPVIWSNMDPSYKGLHGDETAAGTILDGSRFVRACLRRPVDRTPVWFLRQAGRYMQEYREVRKHHTLVEICKQPELAAEVTITAAEKLGVDAAIIFADLLLPLEPMGLDFEFQAGEGPVVHHPVRTAEDVRALRTDRAERAGVCGAGD